MDVSDDELRASARSRVARLFKVHPDTLDMDAAFDEALKASFVSDFRANEFDQLNNDIRDVADRDVLRALSSGALVIRTVGDFCEHMVRCFKTRPSEVVRILGIPGTSESSPDS